MHLPMEEIEKKVGSRYALTVLAGLRARQLRAGAPQLVVSDSPNKILVALQEIYEGKILPENLIFEAEQEVLEDVSSGFLSSETVEDIAAPDFQPEDSDLPTAEDISVADAKLDEPQDAPLAEDIVPAAGVDPEASEDAIAIVEAERARLADQAAEALAGNPDAAGPSPIADEKGPVTEETTPDETGSDIGETVRVEE